MDTTDVTTPLVGSEVENETCFDATDEFEDASSGYESSDSIDSKPDLSRDRMSTSFDNRRCRMDSKCESFKFKSTRMLCEDLKLILDMPELCDVTFLIGPNEVPVHAMRAILGTRSKVFYQLILEQLHRSRKMTDDKRRRPVSDRLYIPVRKYDPETFRMLLQFVHCGTVTITAATVTGLLCGAHQFQLEELEDACWEYIRRCLISGRGENLLAPTRVYKHFRVSEIVLNEIYAELDKPFLNKNLLESTV